MARTEPDRGERGIALILVLLVVVLMYVLVAELVTRSQYDSMASSNQANEVKIRGDMREALKEMLQALVDDLEDEAEEEGGGGQMPGGASGLQGLGPQGAGGAEEPTEEPDVGDHSRDAWFEPKSWFDDNDVVVYGWVVDENRKFNVLTLIAEDEDFRELSRQRLVRLLDHLWEDTDHDLGGSDAETWANLIQELLKGVGWSDDRPRPTLRSNKEGDPRTMIPTLDFLKLIPQIPEEVFEDRFVENGVFLPGLRSVLTVHTALSSGSATTTTTQSTSSNEPDQGGGGGEQGPGGTQTPESEPQMLEPGIRINVNTASRAVLSCLESEQDVPPLVIDAILKWRNEEDEEARQKAEEAQASGDEAALLAGEEGQSFRKIFRTLDDLDELPEWKNLADSEGKNRFLSMLTTKSHVFTVHLAGIHKRGQGGKAFSIMRQRGVYVRLEGEDGAKMQVLVPMHRVTAIRVSRPDFPEQDEYVEGDIDLQALDDPFRAEERVWNPFFLEFYDPKRRAAVLEAR